MFLFLHFITYSLLSIHLGLQLFFSCPWYLLNVFLRYRCYFLAHIKFSDFSWLVRFISLWATNEYCYSREEIILKVFQPFSFTCNYNCIKFYVFFGKWFNIWIDLRCDDAIAVIQLLLVWSTWRRFSFSIAHSSGSFLRAFF